MTDTHSYEEMLKKQGAKPWKKKNLFGIISGMCLLRRKKIFSFLQRKKLVLQKFGSFSNLEVIEIGAGIGTNAALMARRRVNVTALDFSKGTLKEA
jgi:2-polyprenyl-3-methyl-5-hydroxy-6-metoxy-1,4-benzoquinol methylase